MVAIGEGETGFADVKVEDVGEKAFAGQDDSRQVEDWHQRVADLRSRNAVGFLQGKGRFKDHRIGKTNRPVALLDCHDQCRCTRGMVGMILEYLSEDDVRVEERIGPHHALSEPATSSATACSNLARSSSADSGVASRYPDRMPAVRSATLVARRSKTASPCCSTAIRSPSLRSSDRRISIGIVTCPLRVTVVVRVTFAASFTVVRTTRNIVVPNRDEATGSALTACEFMGERGRRPIFPLGVPPKAKAPRPTDPPPDRHTRAHRSGRSPGRNASNPLLFSPLLPY